MAKLRKLEQSETLNPGHYVLEVMAESSLRGEELKAQFTAAFQDTLREVTSDPTVWLDFRPEKIEVVESSSPTNPDQHTGRLWFWITQPSSLAPFGGSPATLTPAVGPLVIVAWLLAITAIVFAGYALFHVTSTALYAVESALRWIIPGLGVVFLLWVAWKAFGPKTVPTRAGAGYLS